MFLLLPTLILRLLDLLVTVVSEWFELKDVAIETAREAERSFFIYMNKSEFYF